MKITESLKLGVFENEIFSELKIIIAITRGLKSGNLKHLIIHLLPAHMGGGDGDKD